MRLLFFHDIVVLGKHRLGLLRSESNIVNAVKSDRMEKMWC